MLYKHKPFVAEYVPAGHGAHVAASEELDPTGPYLPAAHKEPEQAVAPEFGEYFPAEQGVQLPPAPSGPAFPALQY